MELYEKPVSYFCIDEYLECYVAYYDRTRIFSKYVVEEPFSIHLMTKQQIAEIFRIIPISAGIYNDMSITFGGFTSYGSILYDVSGFKPFKPYRLKTLFD